MNHPGYNRMTKFLPSKFPSTVQNNYDKSKMIALFVPLQRGFSAILDLQRYLFTVRFSLGTFWVLHQLFVE